MAKNPETVSFGNRRLQTLVPAASAGVGRLNQRSSMNTRHASVPQRDDIVNRCLYSIPDPWARQVQVLQLVLPSVTSRR